MNYTNNMSLKKMIRPVAKELELFEKEYLYQLSSDTDFLRPLLKYVQGGKGKRLRPVLFFLSQGLIAQPNPESVKIAALLELLHTATLIHDDVVDDSAERRGKKTLNMVWGNHISILFGDYLLAKVLILGVQSDWREALEIIAKVSMNMGKGELRQTIQGIEKKFSGDEYFRIIREKTAYLFMAACELAAVVVKTTEKERARLCQLGENFGMAFQIRDDILDFSGHSDEMGKPMGQDMSNGKVTLPLIMAFEDAAEGDRRRVMQKFIRNTEDDREWIQEFVKKKGGIGKAQEKARNFVEHAREALMTFEPSIYRESLEELMTFDLERMG